MDLSRLCSNGMSGSCSSSSRHYVLSTSLKICTKYWLIEICLFDSILNVPLTIFQLNRDRSVWVEPEDKWVLLKDPQHSDTGEARTPGPTVLSQALYHSATALPDCWDDSFEGVQH